MFKFKFDYLNNTLAYQKDSLCWEQVPENQQFEGDFGSLGFKLGSKLDSGWMAFTVYESKIRVFYKYRESPYWIIRYRKDLPKECPVIFEFTEADQIEKSTANEGGAMNKFATETFSITLGNWKKWLPSLIIEMEGMDYINQLTRQINFRLGEAQLIREKCLAWQEADKLIVGYEVVKRVGVIMNKYQKQINPASQPKYPNKKPAHLKKNPTSHQAWLNAKKARNQAQYLKRDPSATRCLVCYSTKFKPPLKHWIEEKHYQSSLNTVKEIFIGSENPPNNAAEYGRQYIGSVYYCSLKCFNWQAEQAEREDWAKGKCPSCGIDLVVINDQCHQLTHQKEMKYLPIATPNCWKKKGGGQ